MQKADSLSFPRVLGSGGRGQSLLNEISIRAQCWDRDFYGVLMWFENCSPFSKKKSWANSYVIFYETENYSRRDELWRAVICWCFNRDVLWFVGPLSKIFMLSRNVAYIDANSRSELSHDFRSKRPFLTALFSIMSIVLPERDQLVNR